MGKYEVTVEDLVFNTYGIDADSEEDAIKAVMNGEGELVETEETEGTSELVSVEEVE